MIRFVSRVRLLALGVLVAASIPLSALSSIQSPVNAGGSSGTCPSAPTQLANSSFEDPTIPSNSYRIQSQNNVPGWATTATTGNIEQWASVFQGVSAKEGRQFAELNADAVGALYQDLPTTPGQKLVWSLYHRARQGTDTMYVDIGDPGTTGSRQATLTDNVSSGWVLHTGTYTVPAGQTLTRFAFASGPTGSGNPTVGNFLDDVQFGSPSCVVATKSVSPTSGTAVNPGSVLTYSYSLTNQGGSSTQALSVTDVLPANVTYVAGSGGANSSYNAATRTLTLTPKGATGTPGVLEAGQTTQVSFQVTVNTAAAGTSLLNTGSVTETDGYGESSTFSTNTTSTPVNAAADLSITKSFSPDSVIGAPPGTTTMTLTAENAGPSEATNVVVTDTFPIGLTLIAAPAGCVLSNGTYTCLVPENLGVGVQWQFDFVGVSPTGGSGVVTNSASVNSDTFDPNFGNNTATAGLTVNAAVNNLTISKTLNSQSSTISAGEAVAFGFTVVNGGQQTLHNVVLTDSIPTGFTPTCPTVAVVVSCVIGSTSITITLQNLDPGDGEGFVVAESTDPSMTPTTATDSASATSLSPTDVVVDSNTATASVDVINDPELLITKSVTSTPSAGQPVNYQVVFTSLGPSTANNVVVVDTLPSNLTASELAGVIPSDCSLSGYEITCRIGTLAPDSPVTFNFQVPLPPGGGTFVNSVSGSADNSQTVNASATTTVAAEPFLAVSKSVSPTTAKVGDVVTYTLGVSNTGLGIAHGVVVDDNAISNGLQLLSSTAEPGTFDLTTGTWTVGTLAPGASSTISVKAKVLQAGLLSNTVLAVASDPVGTAPSKSVTAVLVSTPATQLAYTGGSLQLMWSAGLVLGGLGIGLFLFTRLRRSATR